MKMSTIKLFYRWALLGLISVTLLFVACRDDEDTPVNIERYRRTFIANTSGIVTNLLIHNGFTYALMTIDGVKKVVRFNANGEQEHAFSPDMQSVNDMVGGNNGSVFFAGNIGNQAGIIKYTTEMNFEYLRNYPFSQAAFANSVAMKGPSVPDGYMVCGALADIGTNDLGFLIDNYQEGMVTNSKIVFSSLEIKRIFRNPEGSAHAFSAFGSWRDPVEQKTDIRMLAASQTGEVFFDYFLGKNNGLNEAIYDATAFNSNQSFAGVGETGGKALFFTTDYQTLTFSTPKIVQNFPSTLTRLSGVCALNDGNFVVAGTEYATDYWGIYLAKVSPDGSILWEKRLTPNTISVFGDIVATPDGGMLVGGQEFCPNSTCPPFPVLYKLDTNGDYQ